MSQQNNGFSLLELMIVVAIIAIIATLALPSKFGQVTQKRMVETVELVEPYKVSIETYYRTHGGEFPEDNAAAGVPDADQVIGNYLRKMEIREGVMHLYLGQKLPKALHGKILSIRPVYVDDSTSTPISWVCGFSEVPEGMSAPGRNLTDIDRIMLPGRCRY